MNPEFLNNSEASKAYLPRFSSNFSTVFDNCISIFGLTFHFEDLLILALAIFLLLQENCDFLLVIALISILF